MRTIARVVFDLMMVFVFGSIILVLLMYFLADVHVPGMDQETRLLALVFASILLASWPVDAISKRVFAPRIHVHAGIPPTVNIVVVRGQGGRESSRLMTVRQDRAGRYVVDDDQ